MSHLGGSGPNGDPITHTPDVWGYVCYTYGLRSVIDIGCAMGFNTKWFLDRGFDAVGVEGFPEYVAKTVLPRDRLVEHDYTKGPYIPKREFDLGLCTEFVEHVEEQYVLNFLATFMRCRFVLMSHALPGQGGFHHVNERTTRYWIDVMNLTGFDHLSHDSATMQATFQEKDRYGRNTLVLFKRR